MKEYITAEPEQVTAFMDKTGNYHDTRDEAIDANFSYDFRYAVAAVIEDDIKRFESMPVLNTVEVVRRFIAENPSMTRVLLGDRDPT